MSSNITSNKLKLPPLIKKFEGSELDLTKLNNTDNITNFINNHGYRLSLSFNTKLTYSYAEVIELLEKLDRLWEDTRKTHNFIS